MTNDEINRKISEAREPKPDYDPRELHSSEWVKRDLHIAPRWIGTRTSIGRWVWQGKNGWQPYNWTGSEDASAVLLEEMPNPGISRGARGLWSCLPDISDLSIEVRNGSRKVAIALAWLKWKGVE